MLAALTAASVMISRRARVYAEDWMTHEFNGNVELSSFRVAIPFPLVQCEGENLVLHFQGRQDLPPLIAVHRFTMKTSLWGLLRSSRRIESLGLVGTWPQGRGILRAPLKEFKAREAETRRPLRAFAP
jgi:hypothetical protein